MGSSRSLSDLILGELRIMGMTVLAVDAEQRKASYRVEARVLVNGAETRLSADVQGDEDDEASFALLAAERLFEAWETGSTAGDGSQPPAEG